jgi:HSP20 family protein
MGNGVWSMVHQDVPPPARKLDNMSTQLWRTRPYAHFPHHIVNGLYEQALARFASGNASDGGSTELQGLPMNVWESQDVYLATLLAPGLDEQTVNVTFHQDTLAIEGSLAYEVPVGAEAMWQDFNPGPTRFRRSLQLGTSVDPSKVEAFYRNGVLTISMPKAEHSKPRQIQVRVASSDPAVG